MGRDMKKFPKIDKLKDLSKGKSAVKNLVRTFIQIGGKRRIQIKIGRLFIVRIIIDFFCDVWRLIID